MRCYVVSLPHWIIIRLRPAVCTAAAFGRRAKKKIGEEVLADVLTGPLMGFKDNIVVSLPEDTYEPLKNCPSVEF